MPTTPCSTVSVLPSLSSEKPTVVPVVVPSGSSRGSFDAASNRDEQQESLSPGEHEVRHPGRLVVEGCQALGHRQHPQVAVFLLFTKDTCVQVGLIVGREPSFDYKSVSGEHSVSYVCSDVMTVGKERLRK